MEVLLQRNRRRLLQALSVLPIMALSHTVYANRKSFRFGMTPAFLHNQHALLEQWRYYMTRNLGIKVEFSQRDSYRETMDLIRLNQLDFAWLCDYPYLNLKHLVRLLAVPVYRGQPIYYSYLIVHKDNSNINQLIDLKGKLFAYADPYSNSGYLVPRYQIHKLKLDPDNFFSKTFFTWSHKKVIEAVAGRLAHGGAVDSFVWDTLVNVAPELTAQTRIIWKSPGFGFPPIVAQMNNVNDDDFNTMQTLLLEMSNNRKGRQLLTQLNIDGFSIQSPELYDGVSDMMKVLGL